MNRTYFLDRIRVVLTILVIAHHTAITYGGSGGWFYREITDEGRLTSLLLSFMCGIDQSFFMGMFFLMAGYFTPPSLERKGTARYVLDRLLRLGVPWLVFGYLLGPITVAISRTTQGHSFIESLTGYLSTSRFFGGPLWFAEALLIFALGYLLVRPLLPSHVSRHGPSATADARPVARPEARPVPGNGHWFAAALLAGASAFAIRQWIPVGTEWFGLQLGFFASYVVLFVVGCMAWPHRWLERVERPQAIFWWVVTLVTIPVLIITAALGGAFAGKPINVHGGWSWPALVYAFWEPFVAWGVIAMLLWRFRERGNTASEAWQRWSARAYGAFIVHAPVIVSIAVLLRGWEAPAIIKFAVVAASGAYVSFAIGGWLLRIPGAKKIL